MTKLGTIINKSPRNLRQNFSTKLNIAARKQAKKNWSDIPDYVTSFKDIFEKENFDKLTD